MPSLGYDYEYALFPKVEQNSDSSLKTDCDKFRNIFSEKGFIGEVFASFHSVSLASMSAFEIIQLSTIISNHLKI